MSTRLIGLWGLNNLRAFLFFLRWVGKQETQVWESPSRFPSMREVKLQIYNLWWQKNCVRIKEVRTGWFQLDRRKYSQHLKFSQSGMNHLGRWWAPCVCRYSSTRQALTWWDWVRQCWLRTFPLLRFIKHLVCMSLAFLDFCLRLLPQQTKEINSSLCLLLQKSWIHPVPCSKLYPL